jgi:hypothetical protein
MNGIPNRKLRYGGGTLWYMAPVYTAADLEMVNKHIAQGERHIVQQEELITRLRSKGLPTDQAEELLAEFEATLHEHRSHRTLMMTSMGEGGGPA